ncbi:MAG TPA: Ig-like domain-containing protein, partial [Gemmatimonadaceae bacterium]|nr:Ig-like domain-containing protein [Gemmatimonadaceae bacterium]
MRKSRSLCALLLLAAACKGSDGVAPLVATSLTVATSPTSISVNGTAQASAIVKDQNGNPLTGQKIAWTSLNTTVASVDGTSGVINGLAAGTATIQGTSGSITGTGTILVVAPVTSCSAGPTVVDLAVGQMKVISAADSKGCIKIPVTGAASQYIVVTANTNSIPDQLATFTLRSDTGEVVPNTSLLANPYRVAAALQVAPAMPTDALQLAFESKLRLLERRELSLPSAQAAYRARSAELPHLRASVSAAVISSVGDKTTFKVPASCSNFTTVTAVAQYISKRAIIYTDSAAPPGGFSATDYQDIANEFDNLIYPTDSAYFGTPSDLDDNGKRVIILYTPQVNKLTPAGNAGGFVGGFFFAGDLFPVTAPAGQQTCQQSNYAEIFYVLAPDPNGTINGNVRTTAQVRQGTRGTIAHEFQHMINASERIRS